MKLCFTSPTDKKSFKTFVIQLLKNIAVKKSNINNAVYEKMATQIMERKNGL